MTDPADVVAQVYRDSLADFTQGAWHVHHAAEPLTWSWHLRVVCDELQALVRGDYAPHHKMLTTIPPGTGKSLLTSVYLPAWLWLHKPSAKILAASADRDVAIRDALRHKEVCSSEWYQDTFAPSWSFDPSQDAKGYFKTTANGARISRTVGQSVTGHRFDLGLVDDPLDARDAVSGNSRLRSHVTWFDRVYTSRRNGRAPIAVTMQRLHDADLAGHLLRRESPSWRHVCLPLEYELGRGYAGDPRTTEGELLSPRYTTEDVAALKLSLGADYFGQCQQRPGDPEGCMFRVDMLRTWRAAERPACNYLLLSVDTALRDGRSNDWTVVQVWGVQGSRRYLLHQERGRWLYPGILDAIKKCLALFPRVRAILVERSNNGAAVIADLSREYAAVIGIDQYTERNSKVSRAQLTLPAWQAGNVYLPSVLDSDPNTRQANNWVGDFVHELLGFPKAWHDDQVDAMSQALNWVAEQEAGAPFC